MKDQIIKSISKVRPRKETSSRPQMSQLLKSGYQQLYQQIAGKLTSTFTRSVAKGTKRFTSSDKAAM
jgi:hypothetical protein